MTYVGPPKWLEAVIAALLPEHCREEVLGDLQERYSSVWRYLADVLGVVPRLLFLRREWSFMNWTMAFALFSAFVGGMAVGGAMQLHHYGLVLHRSFPFLVVLSVWLYLMMRRAAKRPH